MRRDRGVAVGSSVVIVALALTGAAWGAEPSPEPILRIEAGMHTAVIRQVGVNAEGRYLVTGSDDKTARVWEMATGRLLRILRPPLALASSRPS
jgi:WD40 repeat protein